MQYNVYNKLNNFLKLFNGLSIPIKIDEKVVYPANKLELKKAVYPAIELEVKKAVYPAIKLELKKVRLETKL